MEKEEELQSSKKEALPLTSRDGAMVESGKTRERQQTCESLVGGLCGESGGRWVRSQATLGRMMDMCLTK